MVSNHVSGMLTVKEMLAMLKEPKGLEYWKEGKDGDYIDPKAPDWVKKEFLEYMKLMTPKTDKDGTTKLY